MRARLFFLVLVTMVPLLIVVAWTAWVLRDVQDAEMRADLEYLARSASDQLKSAAESGEQLLKTLSQVPGVARGDAVECKRVFGEILGKARNYTTFLVTDARGQVLCHSAGLSEPINIADRAYFQRVRTSKRFTAGDHIVGRVTGKPVMNLAYPLLDVAGDFRGVITAGLDLQWFGERFDHSRPDLDLIFAIWDEDATILYRYPDNDKWAGKRVAETGIGRAVLSRQSDSLIVETTGVTGVPTLYAVRGNEGWSDTRFIINVGVAKAQLHPEANRVLFYSLNVFWAVVAVALLTSWLIAEVGIRRPVAALTAASMRLAAGDRAARTGLSGNDELGRLAATFDWMAASLETEHQRIVQSTESLKRANRALRVLSECNATLIRARDEATLLHDMCRVVVDTGSYHTAWVGYAEQDKAKRIRPVGQAGYEEGYLESLNLTWADAERGHGPMGTAIRTGAPLIARNIPTDLDSIAFRERALQRGHAASIGVPLKNNGDVLGALSIYAAEPDAFDDQEVELLIQLASDLAFGIRTLRNRVELERHRVNLEEILREREDGYGMVLRTALDGFWMVDARGRFLEVNDAYCTLTGYSRDELLAMSILDIEAAESPKETAAHMQTVMRAGSSRFETRHRRKDGAILDVEISTSYLPRDGGRFVVFVRDVTERKRMEEALKDSKRWVEDELARRSAELDESENRLRLVATAIEQAPLSVVITDTAGRIDYVNPGFTRITGHAPKDALGRNPRLLKSGEHDPETYRNLWTTILAGAQWHGELINRRKDGSHCMQDLTIAPVRAADGKISHFVGVAQDVSERKRAEQLLRVTEDRYRDLVENSRDLICTHDLDGRLLSVNFAAAKLLGYSVDELMGMNQLDLLTPKTREHFPQYVAELRDKGAANGVMAIKTASGETRYWEFRNTLRTDGVAVPIVRGMARDVTERRQMERALNESEAKFRGLVEQSLVGIFMMDTERVLYTNPRTAEIFGYASEELVGVSGRVLVMDEDWPAVEREIRRLTSGEVLVAKLDFRGRRKDGQEVTVGAQGLLTRIDGKPIIIGVLQDISDKKRAEEKIQRYVVQLEKALMNTVEVATTISEMRDPYTAGHEHRVAEIAVVIGTELGFDAHRQEGLRIAGHLHDVGKITIPSEILSKPGKLSAAEFALVKGHPQAGYDILKNVEFPWPVAQVALQHHERIDGSGYPQGLKGEEIMLEARIMAVADVVEAMASHRPYRPGLGIDKALVEIERGRGTAYCSRAADACLRLFREKGYQLPA